MLSLTLILYSHRRGYCHSCMNSRNNILVKTGQCEQKSKYLEEDFASSFYRSPSVQSIGAADWNVPENETKRHHNCKSNFDSILWLTTCIILQSQLEVSPTGIHFVGVIVEPAIHFSKYRVCIVHRWAVNSFFFPVYTYRQAMCILTMYTR